jgi:hypothetical protein
MKPILFNTEMVKAILDGRKTQTRRIIKPQDSICNGYECTGFVLDTTADKKDIGCFRFDHEKYLPIFLKPRYTVGDTLWVRETWSHEDTWYDDVPGMEWKNIHLDGKCTWVDYKATEKEDEVEIWRPSIHMPRKFARIFLQVKDVRVERLQDITEDAAAAEGAKAYGQNNCSGTSAIIAFAELWDSIYELPQPVKESGVITHYESYPWKDIQETREYKGKPWIVCGNPWLFVYEFERVEGLI